MLTGTAAAGSGAAAQDFPHSFARAPLARWLEAETTLRAGDVISISNNDVIGAVKIEDDLDWPGARKLEFHAEVVNSRLAEGEGYRSWRGVLRIDCDGPRVQMLAVENYAERNLKGVRSPQAVEPAWTTPPGGSQLETLTSAVCAPDFVRPFADLGQQQAAKAPSDVATDAHATVAEAKTPNGGGYAPVVVQIAAADSESVARGALVKLRGKLGADAPPLDRVAPVVINGKTYWRAQFLGFASTQSAQQMCSALKAARQDCIVKASN